MNTMSAVDETLAVHIKVLFSHQAVRTGMPTLSQSPQVVPLKLPMAHLNLVVILGGRKFRIILIFDFYLFMDSGNHVAQAGLELLNRPPLSPKYWG